MSPISEDLIAYPPKVPLPIYIICDGSKVSNYYKKAAIETTIEELIIILQESKSAFDENHTYPDIHTISYSNKVVGYDFHKEKSTIELPVDNSIFDMKSFFDELGKMLLKQHLDSIDEKKFCRPILVFLFHTVPSNNYKKILDELKKESFYKDALKLGILVEDTEAMMSFYRDILNTSETIFKICDFIGPNSVLNRLIRCFPPSYDDFIHDDDPISRSYKKMKEIYVLNKKIEENSNKHMDIHLCELMKCDPSCALDTVATIDFIDDHIEFTNLCIDGCYYETTFSTDLPEGDYEIISFEKKNTLWDDWDDEDSKEPIMTVSVDNGKATISRTSCLFKVRKKLVHNEKIKIEKLDARVFFITTDITDHDNNDIISIKEEIAWPIPVIEDVPIVDEW